MKLTEKQKSEAVIQFSGKSLGQMVRKNFLKKKKQSFSNRIVHSQKNHKKRNLHTKKHHLHKHFWNFFSD